jgi:hypothetical protein
MSSMLITLSWSCDVESEVWREQRQNRRQWQGVAVEFAMIPPVRRHLPAVALQLVCKAGQSLAPAGYCCWWWPVLHVWGTDGDSCRLAITIRCARCLQLLLVVGAEQLLEPSSKALGAAGCCVVHEHGHYQVKSVVPRSKAVSWLTWSGRGCICALRGASAVVGAGTTSVLGFLPLRLAGAGSCSILSITSSSVVFFEVLPRLARHMHCRC